MFAIIIYYLTFLMDHQLTVNRIMQRSLIYELQK